MEIIRLESIEDITSLMLERQVTCSLDLQLAGSRRTYPLGLGFEAMFLLFGRVQLSGTHILAAEIERLEDDGDSFEVGNIILVPK